MRTKVPVPDQPAGLVARCFLFNHQQIGGAHKRYPLLPLHPVPDVLATKHEQAVTEGGRAQPRGPGAGPGHEGGPRAGHQSRRRGPILCLPPASTGPLFPTTGRWCGKKTTPRPNYC